MIETAGGADGDGDASTFPPFFRLYPFARQRKMGYG
jgi:hypothetical protein